MAAFVVGPRTWSGSVDDDGHRTYKVVWRVKTESFEDGPKAVMDCPDLPRTGDIWSISSDLDPWAWCRRNVTANPVIEGEPNLDWLVEQTFSTKPLPHCQDDVIDDPLIYPDKVSGSFRTLSREAASDRFGRRLMNSAHEQLRGPNVEFDQGFATVRIEQNRSQLDFDDLTEKIHTVNDAALWGFAARCIKLSRVSWECLYTGHCVPYVKRVLEFDIDPRSWDREVWDEGTLVLRGKWSPDGGEWIIATVNGKPADPNNPKHFQQFADPNGNPRHSFLNGGGLPADSSIASTDKYVSRKGSNVGNTLDNTEWWIPLIDVNPPKQWNSLFFYPLGARVLVGAAQWLAVDDVPPGDLNPAVSDMWESLPTFFNDGSYNAGSTYVKGAYVNALIRTRVAKIHVEYYNESNFLELGVPTVLRCST